MASTSFASFWSTPELKVHVGKMLATKHDLLHFAQTDKATCPLLLPLLYEDVCITIDYISQITDIFQKYPHYASQCRRLRIESPDKIERSYLDGKMWRDKSIVEKFQSNPSKRYREAFVPDWHDDTGHSVSPSEESDPADWIMDDALFDGDGDGDDLDGEGDNEHEHESGDEDEDEDEVESEAEAVAENHWRNMMELQNEWTYGHAMQAMYEESSDGEDGPSTENITRVAEVDASLQAQILEEMDTLQYEDGELTKESWLALLAKHEHDDNPLWLRTKASLERGMEYIQREKKREAEGVPRHRQQCADVCLVLKQLHDVGRLTCFEWVWASNDHGSWKISGADSEVWTALEKHAPSLEKLVLKLFRGDKQTWTSFASTNYGTLRVLHLNMLNAHHWQARPLHDMLKQLPKLEALDLKLTWCCSVQEVALVGTYPKLRYFSWESGSLKERLEDGEADPKEFFQRHPELDTLELNISCTSLVSFKFEDDCILPRLHAISYGGKFRPDLSPLSHIVARRPVVVVRSRLPRSGLLAFVRLPASASATVRWLDVRYYTNFRLDLASPTFQEALHTVPQLKELTIRTSSAMFDQRLTPLDVPDVLNAIPHDHPLKAVTLCDPDGDALNASDLENLPPISPFLKYLGWETNAGRVLYALEQQGDKTVAKEIPYQRKTSWVWTQNSILDHSEGEFWTDPFDGDVIPGVSRT